MSVHNHGTEDGPGIGCPERRLPNGKIRGACLQPAGRPADLEDALERYTHAIVTGAEFGELQVAFINLKVAHQKFAYGQYLAEVGCNGD